MGANARRSCARAKKCQEEACASAAEAGAGLAEPRAILKNGLIFRPWTAEEDEVLRSHMVYQMGTYVGVVKANWLLVQREMQWRSVDQMRARWRRIQHLHVPNMQRMAGPTKGTMCKRCGVPRAGHACPFSKPMIVARAVGGRKRATPNAKTAVVAEEAPMPMLDDFVVWQPASHADIGDVGGFLWVVTEIG